MTPCRTCWLTEPPTRSVCTSRRMSPSSASFSGSIITRFHVSSASCNVNNTTCIRCRNTCFRSPESLLQLQGKRVQILPLIYCFPAATNANVCQVNFCIFQCCVSNLSSSTRIPSRLYLSDLEHLLVQLDAEPAVVDVGVRELLLFDVLRVQIPEEGHKRHVKLRKGSAPQVLRRDGDGTEICSGVSSFFNVASSNSASHSRWSRKSLRVSEPRIRRAVHTGSGSVMKYPRANCA